jgi:hypothetical protein
MGVTIELQNLGDGQLSREIVASIEHALSDKTRRVAGVSCGITCERELGDAN